MSACEWDGIISAMKACSGGPLTWEMPDAVAAQIQQLTGIEVPPGRRRFARSLPSVEFEPGLSDSEVIAVEKMFGFRFPTDLRAFLQTALPRGEQFPNWRSGDAATLRDWQNIPRQGVLFDVERNGFWLSEWGPRPESLGQALRIASDLVSGAPKLIPIYGNRMMPDEPHSAGNPVFSVHQTDIIYYGFDLADYLRHEFDLPGREPWPEQVRAIRFWDIDRFQEVRWSGDSCIADPRTLPVAMRGPAQANEQGKKRRGWRQFWKRRRTSGSS